MKGTLNHLGILCLMLLSFKGMKASAASIAKAVRVDLTNGALLTADEIANKSMVSFGVAVAGDGTVSRVESSAADALATLGGKFHSNEHGWTGFSATVAVTGPVKITMGTCAWGGDVIVKDASDNTVATMNTNTGACFHQNKDANVVSAYYKGSEATTLTISGGNYVPYFAVETADPSELVSEINVKYALEGFEAEGTLPADGKAEVGSDYTVPVNRTLFIAGKTLTGWTDGTDTYASGTTFKAPEADVTLTPVFADNTVSLADATDTTTLLWDFQRKNGAPLMSYQNKTGIYVTQATVAGQTIDVKMDFDTNNGGKIANGNWTDWCQMNAGTKLTVPSVKGAAVSMEAYENITTTTIDGQSDYAQGTTISYNVPNAAEIVDIVIGDGSYYKYVKVVLPQPVPTFVPETFSNETATVEFPFTGNTTDAAIVSPEKAISITAFAHGTDIADATPAGYGGINYTRFQPVSGAGAASDAATLEWSVKPAKGITFTPTKVSANIRRFGTDGGLVDIKVVNDEGVEETLATGLIPARNKAAADDSKSSDPNWRESFSLDVPATLATTKNFRLVMYLYALGNTKQFGINNVRIDGTVNGQTKPVEKFSFSASANIAEGGSVKVYPAGDEYEAGTELMLTAVRNFGYKFVSWTDATGSVISDKEKLTYVVNTDAVLTANFEKINTYVLSVEVEGGAADYMVATDPMPTVIDGKNMYEEGTEVTLTASSNEILTFTNWSDGQTSSEIKLMMNADQSVTASYSAKDFIAAWDFVKKGNNGRTADFAAADNDADQLVLRDAAGTTYGWLDKSSESGGYEGRPAGVNWKNDAELGTYYWQIKVNASAFTDIKVKSAMAYNYNAYQTYNVDWSLNGENWTNLGSIIMPGVKNWVDSELALPADANNQETVYVRWIADKTSNVDGTASQNDGNAIGAIYVLGTTRLVDDGTAPVLVSCVPKDGATNASANGKIVLTFDEKVKLSDGAQATVGSQSLMGVVSGKTVTFEYKGLEYATAYTFTLAASSIADLTDNAIAEPIVIAFTTKNKDAVAKKAYDFVVPDDGDFVAALNAANSRTDKSVRYRIFVKKGEYTLPVNENVTVDGSDGKTYNGVTRVISANNISIIGEDRDATVIKNDVPYGLVSGQWGPACPIEGIGKCDVLQITGRNIYLQDITVKNGTDDATGRNLAIQEKGDKTIYKNTCLYGYQDTWTSNGSGRYYFEDGIVRGRTDYICGKGDVFFNGITFQNVA